MRVPWCGCGGWEGGGEGRVSKDKIRREGRKKKRKVIKKTLYFVVVRYVFSLDFV